MNVVFGLTSADNHEARDYSSFTESCRTQLEIAYRLATAKQDATQAWRKNKYGPSGTDLQLGSLELIKNFTRKGKLDPYWQPERREILHRLAPDLPVHIVKRLPDRKEFSHHRNIEPESTADEE